METKTLLAALAGFFIGGLVVSIVATTTTNKPDTEMSMNQMTQSLQNKTGDGFDRAFVDAMIMHHQSAVDMAKLSADRAKHDEIKLLSKEIIRTQSQEISQMRHWQVEWAYPSNGHADDSKAH